MIEKRHRIDDALEAVRSAQEEGIITGGGTALMRASQSLSVETDNDEQAMGVSIVLEAVEEPLRQMALNAGESPDIIVNKVTSTRPPFGYNFVTNEIENLYENGIIDPVKVSRCALENAASVASTLITTNYAIVHPGN